MQEDEPKTEMDIDMAHQYSHLGGKKMRLTYDYPEFNFTRTLEVCEGCTRSMAKVSAVRKKKYTRATKPRETIFVDRTGTSP